MNKTEDPLVLNKAWDILRKTARDGKKITYGELGPRIGVGAEEGERGNGRGVARVAGRIGEKCNELGVPCLNALIVSATTGRSGEGIEGGAWSPALPDDLERGVIWTWPGIYDALDAPFGA